MIFELAEDFHDAVAAMPKGHANRRVVQLLEQAVRQSARILSDNPGQLVSQLVGRLQEIPASELRAFLSAAPSKKQRWLRPMTASLTTPGSPLLLSINEGNATVSAIDVTPDGRWILASFWDGTTRVWDIDTGRHRYTLRSPQLPAGCDYRSAVNDFPIVEQVRVLADGRRAVSVGPFSAIHLWDLETGSLIHSLSETCQVEDTSSDLRQLVEEMYERERAKQMGSSAALADNTPSTDKRADRAAASTRLYRTKWNKVRIVPEKELAVTASYDGTLTMWNVISGKMQPLQPAPRQHPGFSPNFWVIADSGWILSCRYQRGVPRISGSAASALWNLTLDEAIQVLQGKKNIATEDQPNRPPQHDSSAMQERTGEAPVQQEEKCIPSTSPPDQSVERDSYTLQVWSMESGAMLGELPCRTGPVATVEGLGDGRRIAVGLQYGDIDVWNVLTGELLCQIDAHCNERFQMTLLPDSHCLLYAAKGNGLGILDIGAGCTAVLCGHSGEITDVAVLPGAKAITASADRSIRIWDLNKRETTHVCRGHWSVVSRVLALPNGRQFLSTSEDGTIRVWDAETGECVNVFCGHTSAVGSLAVTPDGRRVASTSRRRFDNINVMSQASLEGRSSDVSLRIWSLDKQEGYAQRTGHTGKVTALSVLLDGLRVLSASADHTVRLWNGMTGEELAILEGHADRVNTVIPLLGEHAVSGSDDGELRLWDLTQRVSARLGNETLSVVSLVGSPASPYLLSFGLCCHLVVWDLSRMARLRDFCAVDKEHPAAHVAQVPRTLQVATWGVNGNVAIWDLLTARFVKCWRLHDAPISTVWMSRDGTYLVSAAQDHTQALVDLRTGEILHSFCCHSPVVAIETLSGDALTALVTEDGAVALWNLHERRCVRMVRTTARNVRITTTMVSGKRIALGGTNGSIAIVDIESDEAICAFTGDSAITALAATADGLHVIAGEASGAIHFLQVEGTSALDSCLPAIAEGTSDPFLLYGTLQTPIVGSTKATGDILGIAMGMSASGEGVLQEIVISESDARANRELRQADGPKGGSIAASDAYRGSPPHALSDANRAAEMNIAYQRELAHWKSLPWWERLRTRRPQRPTGI